MRRSHTLWAGLFGLLALAAAGPLRSADPAKPPAKPDAPAKPADLHGDPLPAGALARLGTVRFRHSATSVAYSPDGKLIATGGADNRIVLFDAQTGKEVRRLTGHQARTYNAPRQPKSPVDVLVSSVKEGNVTAVAFSPDGNTLASGGWDDTVRLWDVKTSAELRRLHAHQGMVAAVTFSRNGKLLATRGGIDGIVRVWEPTSGKQLYQIESVAKVNPWRFNRSAPLAFSPDSETLAVGDAKAIRFFAAATGKEGQRWEAHPSVTSLAYSADGKLLATGGVDGHDKHSLRIWDVAKGQERLRCQLPKDEPPIDLAFSPSGKQLAAVIEEDDLRLFDVATGKATHRLSHYWPSRVAYAPDGKTLVSARGPALRLWDPATGKEGILELEGHQAAVASVALAPDGKAIVTGGEDLRYWAPDGKPLRRVAVKGGVTVVAYAPDGKTLATAGRDRIVRLWNVETGQQVQELKGHKHGLCGLAFSPDGKKLASGDMQATVRIWDVQTPKELHVIDVKSGTESLSLAFSPDNKSLACAGAWNDTSFLPPNAVLNIQGVEMTRKEGYAVLVWDVSSGKETKRFTDLKDKVKSVAYAPDGKTLAAATRDGRVILWDVATGKDRLHILAHPEATDAAFSPTPAVAFGSDGRTLVTAGTDKTVRVWDAFTAKELARLRGEGGFLGLVVSRDGKLAVTGSADTTATVWDLANAAKVPPLAPPGVILIGD